MTPVGRTTVPTTGTGPGDPPSTVPGADRHRLRGTRVSARWRIVGWLLLTVSLALVTTGLVVHTALAAMIVRDVDAEVLQEVEEFATFVEDGRDPVTAAPFTTTRQLLGAYLDSQYPGDDEMILGVVEAPSPVIMSLDRGADVDDTDPYPGLTADGEVLAAMSDAAAASGVLETPAGPMRWGRVDVVGATAADPAGALLVTHFTGPRTERLNQAMQLIGGVAFLGLTASAGMAWLVAGRMLAPVAEIHRVAASIGERDLTRRVPVRGRDDVAALAAAFNAMLDRVEEAYRIQRQFVDDAGHELRTPITVVRGHLELMGDDPDDRAATLRLVNDELDRMNRIVGDLLVLAKAERPDFVRTADVDVADLTLEIEAKVSALGDRTWVLAHVGEGTARLDAQRVTQAVLQLAANAVAHTRTRAHIRLGSHIDAVRGTVTFWVADTGPGVPEADVDHVFERFAHGSAAPPGGQRPGAGLGLAIVRAIAEAHGGHAWLTSIPGVGATFGLDLPGARPVAPDSRPGSPPVAISAVFRPVGHPPRSVW